MDKETIALIIAQNGLGTASTLLLAKAAKLKRKLETAGPDRAKIEADIRKTEKLVIALEEANKGLLSYMGRTA